MEMVDANKAKEEGSVPAFQETLAKSTLPQWFLDYTEALKRIEHSEYSIDDWDAAYDTLFGEEEWQASDIGSIAHAKPIDFPIENDTKRKAYETILQVNSFGLDLNTPIFHYTTSSYLDEAIKRGGFVLAHPKDWSHNWEDSAFKNYFRNHENDTSKEVDIVKASAESYSNYSYAMCWTFDSENQSLIEKKKRDNSLEKIVIISSTVQKLLRAYITDNISAKSCFMVPMKYMSEKYLRKVVVDPLFLGIGDHGTEAHNASISVTSDRFAEQNEVRLLVENSPSLFGKEIIRSEDNDSGHVREMLIKLIDIKSIINSVIEADNGIDRDVVDSGIF